MIKLPRFNGIHYSFHAIGLFSFFYFILTSPGFASINEINDHQELKVTQEEFLEIPEEDKLEQFLHWDMSKKALEGCADAEYWKDTRVTFDYERGDVIIQFPSTPREVGIEKLELVIHPKELNILSHQSIDDGFHLHNIKRIPLSKDKLLQVIPMPLSVTNVWALNHKVKDNITGYKKLVNTELRAYSKDLVGASSYSICNSLPFNNINLFEFDNLSRLTPYFEDNTLNPSQVLEVSINNFEQELNYLDSRYELNQLRRQNNSLPKPNEEALALLRKEFNYDKDAIGKDIHKWEWTLKPKWRRRSHAEGSQLVFGLFGEVESSDFKTLSTIIKVLHVVAPHLDASYSSDPNKVTLPIHYTSCTSDSISSGFDCKKNSGLFINGNYGVHNDHGRRYDIGWIWIDSSSKEARRNIILYHEIGHSLGLVHNKCYNSRMSYEISDSGWTQLDLMMLNVLYNPIQDNDNLDSYDYKPNWINYMVATFNLDGEKVEHLLEEPWKACEKREKGWENLLFLIEGQ